LVELPQQQSAVPQASVPVAVQRAMLEFLRPGFWSLMPQTPAALWVWVSAVSKAASLEEPSALQEVAPHAQALKEAALARHWSTA
jgi:hypothetical protein